MSSPRNLRSKSTVSQAEFGEYTVAVKIIQTHRTREAAYTLTTYLESKEPGIQFDPPSPFSARRAPLQRRPSSTSLSSQVDSNFNHKRPSSSEPGPRPDLDVEDAPRPLTILELGSGTGIIVAKLAEIISDQGANNVPTG